MKTPQKNPRGQPRKPVDKKRVQFSHRVLPITKQRFTEAAKVRRGSIGELLDEAAKTVTVKKH